MKRLFAMLLALVMLLAAFPVAAMADAAVPGTTAATALEVDPTDSGTFIFDNFTAVPSDLWLKVTLPKRGLLDFTCTKMCDFSGDVDTVYFYLYKEANTQTPIWQDDSYDYENLPGDYEFRIPLAAGTYYLRLDASLYGEYREMDYSLKFTANNSFEAEPNNGAAMANKLTMNKKMYGYTGGSVDYFSIKVSKNTPARLYIGSYNKIDESGWVQVTYPDNSYEYNSQYKVVMTSSSAGYMDVYLKKGTNIISVSGGSKIFKYYIMVKNSVSYKAPTITKITRDKYSFKVNWKEMIGISGYQVYYRTSKTGSWKLLKDCNSSYYNGLTYYDYNAKKFYQVRMRTYRLFGSTKYYSDWSKTISIIPTPTNIKLSATSLTYNGKKRVPTVTIKDINGKTLKLGTDYTIKYSTSSPKKIGTYTITITFKGDYTGTVKKTFKIVPAGTKVSKVTAATKSLKVTVKKQATQTSGYEIQVSTSSKFSSGNKLVKLTKNTKTSTTIKGLKAKKKYYVRVRTYKTVNGEKFYSAWSKATSKKTK